MNRTSAHVRGRWLGLLFLAAFVAAPPLASAWPTDPGLDLPVMTGANCSTYEQVAADGSGGAYVVWSDNRAGNYDIYVQHILPTGINEPAWPVNGLPICTAAGDQSWPQIISDGAGGAIACWQDARSGTADIYAQRVTAGGTVVWGPNGRTVCTATGAQAQPRLVTDLNSGAIITWFDERTGIPNDDIYAQHVTSAGVIPHGWPIDGRPICTAAGPQSAPCIVSDLSGGAIIAWYDQRSGSHIYAQHIALTGIVDATWPVDGRLICSAQSSTPSEVSDLSGGAVIVWVDTRVAGTFDLYAHHVLNNGMLDASWPVDGVAVCTAAGVQGDVAMVGDGSGGAYLAWDDKRAGGSEYDIYAHHVLSTGVADPLWPANGRAVDTDPGSQILPTIAYTGDGVIVAWGGTNMRAQHLLAADGSFDPRWPAAGRQLGLGSLNHEWAPSACADIWNGAIVAWQDARSLSVWEVYAERVSNNSALGNDFTYFTAFTGVYKPTCLWADLNGDEYLDLLVSGADGVGSRIDAYGWNGSTFSNLVTNLPGIEWSSIAAGDYDGDGDLDLALCGYSNGTRISRIYRNAGNGLFTDANAGLPGVYTGVVAWADVDNDGDLDLLLAGRKVDSSLITKIYTNTNGVFTDSGMSLTGLGDCSAAWADFDNDGDQDLAMCGWNGSAPVTKLYINSGGTLSDSGIPFFGVEFGDLEWTDVNHDGFLDLMVIGWNGAVRLADLYYGTGSGFASGTSWSPGLSGSALAAGDMDNDGDPDFLESGFDPAGGMTKIQRRDEGIVFRETGTPLPGVYNSSVAWGDFNRDGNLDLAVAGTTGSVALTNVYTSYATTPNAPPSPPGSLAVAWNGNRATFSWTAASDDHTPQAALTYNLKVGTTPGGNQIMAASSANDGRARVAQIGNCGTRTSWTITMPAGTFYWNVQAIDGAFLGSTFAAGVTTTAVGDGSAPSASGLLPASPNPFRARTEIAFTLPRAGDVELAVFDPAGRRVKELSRGAWPAGLGRVSWDGRDAAGAAVANGLYFVRLESEGRAWTGKVVVAR